MKIQSSKPEKKDFSYYLSRVKRFFHVCSGNMHAAMEILRREKSLKAAFSVGRESTTSDNGRFRRAASFAVLLLIFLVLIILLFSGLRSCSYSKRPETAAVNAPVSTEAVVQTTLTPEQLHVAYPQNLVVIGDSIASGYHLYEFIPEEHGLACGNAAIRSLHEYTYTYNGQENMDVTDIVADMQPAFILMSMGMNDINLISAEDFTSTYQKEIEGLLTVSPKTNVVVAGITPIEYGNTFVAVTKLMEYNAALEQMIQDMGRANVTYFDAFSLLSDPSTLGLKAEYSAGDGIHLATKAYEVMLNALYPLLDTMPYPENLVTETEPAMTASATIPETAAAEQ